MHDIKRFVKVDATAAIAGKTNLLSLVEVAIECDGRMHRRGIIILHRTRRGLDDDLTRRKGAKELHVVVAVAVADDNDQMMNDNKKQSYEKVGWVVLRRKGQSQTKDR